MSAPIILPAVPERPTLTREPTGSASVGWWGMVLLIVVEATLFAALISSYFYLRFLAPSWPLGGIDRPDLLLPAVASVVLLSSSWPMHMAERSIKRGNRRGLQIGLAISFVLAAFFLGLQAYEYIRSQFTPWTNAYGSLFFTITGFHGLHVVGALLLNAWTQLHAWRGQYTAKHNQSVTNVALYWHFVDAVWVVVLLSVYLSPYLI